MIKSAIFHPTIAPYRIDFFNDLVKKLNADIFLRYRNLKDQKFDYERIEEQFQFTPSYIPENLVMKLLFIIKTLWREYDYVIVGEFGLETLLAIVVRWITQRKYKIISLCDDSYDMIANHNDFSLTHRWARKIFTPLIDNLVLIEPKVKDWYIEHYQKGIYFPIIRHEKSFRKLFRDTIPITQSYIQEQNLKNRFVYLFVGRLTEVKNLKKLFLAFQAAQLPNACLIIVGSGDQDSGLRQLANQLEVDIRIVGRYESEALYAWYNLADCFVLPSTREAFGAVVYEALVSGCKCVVSEKAGSASLISAKNGLIVNPHSIQDITKALQRIYYTSVSKPIEKRENLANISYNTCFNQLISEITKQT